MIKKIINLFFGAPDKLLYAFISELYYGGFFIMAIQCLKLPEKQKLPDRLSIKRRNEH